MKIYNITHTVYTYEKKVKIKHYLLFLPELYKDLGPEKTGILYKDGKLKLNYFNNKNIVNITLLNSKNCLKEKNKLKKVLKEIENINDNNDSIKGTIIYFKEEFIEAIENIMKGE